jgi:ABC-type lipoprotein export system ATPase subunit
MPALIAGESFSNAKDKAMRLLEKVGLVQQIEQKPSELSGGEQQRTAIARALINDPSIIFADEPTGNLDKFNSDSILELIKDLKEQFGKTFIIATHSPDVASIAERVLQMNDGKII